MIKKKVLSIGCAVVLGFSYFGTSVFANSGAGFENSIEVEMIIDDNGNVVYEYTDADGVTRTSTTTDSIGLTKNRFDMIYGINKWDSDNIVVTVKEVPKDGATTSFEIINNFGETISSSCGTQYSKDESWIAKSSGGFGTPHYVRANPSVTGKYKFHLQW